jgi:hypothetical protein
MNNKLILNFILTFLRTVYLFSKRKKFGIVLGHLTCDCSYKCQRTGCHSKISCSTKYIMIKDRDKIVTMKAIKWCGCVRRIDDSPHDSNNNYHWHGK